MRLVKPDHFARLMRLDKPVPISAIKKDVRVGLKALLMLCVLILMLPIELRAQTLQREADKAEAIKRIMASRTFHTGSKALPFCKVFLEDFREQKGIKYVEPLVRTESYDAPALQPYKDRCPDLEMHKLAECSQQDWSYVQSLPEEEREREMDKVCRVYYGTRNFKLYELDLNGNPKDGKEVAVYFERIYGPQNISGAMQVYSNGGYAIFDIKSCRRWAWTPTNDPNDYLYNQPLENYNALIQYKGKYYIFNLYELGRGKYRDPNKLEYRLHIGGNRKNGWGGLCSFSTISESAKAKGEAK
jgi:hypothetical protein